MPKISLVTDTNASLLPEIVEKYGIIQVPIHIQFDEETYITGQTINDQSLFEMIDARKTLPTTAAPSPNAFENAYQQALDEGADQIICICCSSKVSATYNAALMALEAFPDADITVVDSLMLSLAEGYQVILAAEAVENGTSKEDILDLLKANKDKVHVYGALPTLKYLAMGGRMGKLAAGFGDTLEIKPILTMRDGKLELLEKVRTWKKARERLIELAVQSVDSKTVQWIGMFHVNNESGAEKLYARLAESLTLPDDRLIAEFTPGLSVHAGSGVIGFVIITN